MGRGIYKLPAVLHHETLIPPFRVFKALIEFTLPPNCFKYGSIRKNRGFAIQIGQGLWRQLFGPLCRH